MSIRNHALGSQGLKFKKIDSRRRADVILKNQDISAAFFVEHDIGIAVVDVGPEPTSIVWSRGVQSDSFTLFIAADVVVASIFHSPTIIHFNLQDELVVATTCSNEVVALSKRKIVVAVGSYERIVAFSTKEGNFSRYSSEVIIVEAALRDGNAIPSIGEPVFAPPEVDTDPVACN